MINKIYKSASVISLFSTLTAPFEKKISTIEIINAPAERVYQKMIDFSSYPSWGPFIKSIKGELRPGRKLNVFIRPEGKNGMAFNPTVLSVVRNKEIRWIGRLGFRGIFDGEHYFLLEKIDENTTRLVHGENFCGVLVPIFWIFIKDSTTKGFEAHNKALRKRAEASNK